jgi:uncharacterized protein (DUF924 family)
MLVLPGRLSEATRTAAVWFNLLTYFSDPSFTYFTGAASRYHNIVKRLGRVDARGSLVGRQIKPGIEEFGNYFGVDRRRRPTPRRTR